jgi:hypothetical protein
MDEWDLRDSNDVEAIGWPSDRETPDWERRAEDGLERILLPEGLVLEGFDRANPSRLGGVAGIELSDRLDSMVVAYANRSIPEVRDLAVALAEEIGDDPGTYTSWAARNADEVDLSIDGSRGRGPSVPVGHLSVTLQTRAADEDRASLYVTVFWPDDLVD